MAHALTLSMLLGTFVSCAGPPVEVAPPTDECGDVPVTGVCVSERVIRTCVFFDTTSSQRKAAKVLETQCRPDRKCRMDNEVASCALIGECSVGDRRCTSVDMTKSSKDPGTVQTCVEGDGVPRWEDSKSCKSKEKCLAMPGTLADCLPVGEKSERLVGKVRYEFRPVNEGMSAWGDIKIADAPYLFVAAFDGHEKMIGWGMTGYDPDTQEPTGDGSFKIDLTAAVDSQTSLWVWPMRLTGMANGSASGAPLLAMAKATAENQLETAKTATEYWQFGTMVKPALNAQKELDRWVIRESEGSGAIHAFEYLSNGMIRAAEAMPDRPQRSLVVYWTPGMKFECPACYCGPECGGGRVSFGGDEADFYDTWMALGGDADSATHWSGSVISHEFGHYVMQTYSKMGNEGGAHNLMQKCRPTLAYNEGWATAFGQTSIASPFYVMQEGGTVYWFDISKYTFQGSLLPLADPSGGLDQNINELLVAGMIWKLWVPTQALSKEIEPIGADPEGRGLGDARIFKALRDPKLVTGALNRGYPKIDIVDFFDAMLCSGVAEDEDIQSVVDTVQFPYMPEQKVCR